ncbi:MAG: Tim44 domain-containing protein [bacterium]
MRISGLIAALLLTFTTGLFVSTDVEAKRLGGGMSFGGFSKKPTFSREAKPFSTPAKPANPQAKPGATGAAGQAAGRRGGLMGPLMGLAAGGLLAAMFMGGAFDGIQLFDILIIGALIFGVMMFLKSRRQRQEPVPAGGPWQREAPADVASRNQYRREETASSGTFSIPEIGAGLKSDELAYHPEWFDESAFMAEVDKHYEALQKHWDAEDMQAISEYVTPEMLAHLREQRAALEKQPHTEVVQLHSQLLDVNDAGNNVIASILFSGLINEDHAPSAKQFAEIWHVQHPKASAEGDWLLAGIEQYET